MIVKEDNELVFEVIKGSISSFEILLDRYQKTIFNLVLKMVGDTEVARDLTQDIFVKAFENLGKFDFKYRFFNWVYTIAINETINFRKVRHPVQDWQSVEGLAYEPDDQSKDLQRKRLHSALRSLTPEYSMLLLLKHYCGLSYAEIAEATKLTEKKIKSRLYIARKQLHDRLDETGFFSND